MNENAKNWVTALRSGEYSQCQGSLRRGDSFCCLGVACDLYAKEHTDGFWFTREETNSVEFDSRTGVRSGVLPECVKDWLGMRTNTGIYEDASGKNLPHLNDNQKWSFNQIADFIEQHQEELFHE